MSDLFYHLYIFVYLCSLLLPNVFQTAGSFWRNYHHHHHHHYYYYSAVEVTACLWYVTIVIQNWFQDWCMAVVVKHMLSQTLAVILKNVWSVQLTSMITNSLIFTRGADVLLVFLDRDLFTWNRVCYLCHMLMHNTAAPHPSPLYFHINFSRDLWV
jgi:hypothetical protein